ncbi:uncharacterized protein Z518_08384 [Rhinocladiella mackenziei CBS 650.93]|uniref:LicD/FKTN/FKRP nucleotidyltransferase domain-containing protein n=1 Tax=Rhinocladiella mackenziei CBS 650.93 TaxID=1442369 RepID=A0A0D2GW22_9EURO|nr:uncharacterized protein Z518_08384 [Rhinocladiella mackenziei CBS 650.93]KIX02443.1 hypothetical protein Z518_08384 [Rhinocladiella mackenziei CBS 650.93]
MPAFVPLRSRNALLCSLGIVALLLFLVHQSGSPTPAPLPPMPGTYQYFTEIDFKYHTRQFGAISHCDPRFAPKDPPGIPETRQALVALLKSYMATMSQLGADDGTWIAHGALLGWYWNQKLLPWDTDLDVQMSAETLAYLVPFNMTEYWYVMAGEEKPRTYLLDINPHHSISSTRDVANKIDGRWIDTSNGKYIDITAVHVRPLLSDVQDPPQAPILFCKDGHEYQRDDLFPLRDTSLEGVRVKVPRDSAKVLQDEYGKKSLTNTRFHWHRFDKSKQIWEPE